jgi:hypothetical protein
VQPRKNNVTKDQASNWVKRLGDWIAHPAVVAATLVVALTGTGLAFNAQASANRASALAAAEANARAKLATDEAAHQRDTFCDFFVSIGDPALKAQFQSPAGLRIYDGSVKVVSPTGLGCPQPTTKP